MGKFAFWILLPRDDGAQSPWDPWYDKAFGFIVSAETEQEARQIANDNGGYETGPISQNVYRTGGDPWLDPKWSTCKLLEARDKAEVIMTDFYSA